MKYDNVIIGTFVSRPNRFIAYVMIDGAEEVCHVKNTGRCRELLIPGARVVLSVADNPARKTKYDLVAVWKGERLINMDSQAPNAAFGEWARKCGLEVRPETKFGNSRFDFYYRTDGESGGAIPQTASFAQGSLGDGRSKPQPYDEMDEAAETYGDSRDGHWPSANPAYSETDGSAIHYNSRNGEGFIEVKGVTLESDGVARFPDAPTLRGAKHVRELIKCREAGLGAHIVFVVQMAGMKYVTPNSATDPDFAAALRDAQAAGVNIVALECSVTPDSMEIAGVLPFVPD